MSETDVAAPVDEERAPLVQLFPDIDPDGHAAAYLPVRWCLDTQLISELEQRSFDNPYLMITVRRTTVSDRFGEEVETKLDVAHFVVPLQQELAYLSFRHAGHNELIATVVNIPDEYVAKQVTRWINNPGNVWDGSLFDESGSATDALRTVPHIETRFQMVVDVDPKMFAKEPAAWVQWLTGKFFEGKPRDECHNRARLGLSFLYAFASVTVMMALRLVAFAVVLLLDFREINWKALNPFEWRDGWPLESYTDYTSIWIHKPNGASRGWWSWLLNPITLLVPPALGWLIAGGFAGVKLSGQSYFGLWFAFLAVLVLVISLLAGVVVGIIQSFGPITKRTRTKRTREQIQQDERDARRKALRNSLEAMTCDLTGGDPRVSALPQGKRTIRLRFAAAKGKICKPFTR